jgi:hypothetical protein
MTPVLGDFLLPARAHITAAARDGGGLPIPAHRGVIAERSRLVSSRARSAVGTFSASRRRRSGLVPVSGR